MLSQPFSSSKREMHSRALSAEFVVIGGGFAGVCAAVTAARSGTKTILVQDRPVLGGNASSEVRLWILGATSHMGNNNRWSREGGLVDEILIENLYRNKEGNPVILDTILLEKVYQEPNITLLLNTAVWDIEKADPQTVSKVYAFCSQNSTFYEISGRLFCDASGDGILAYRAGAAFRMGAEEKRCYNEQFAPDKGEFGELLGHSIYFYSLDTGKPVKFVPPSYALKDITRIPRWRKISSSEHGCRFWWLEYGGRLDTIHDTEQIKWKFGASSTVCGIISRIRGIFPMRRILPCLGSERFRVSAKAAVLKVNIRWFNRISSNSDITLMRSPSEAGLSICIPQTVFTAARTDVFNTIQKEFTKFRTAAIAAGIFATFFWRAAALARRMSRTGPRVSWRHRDSGRRL